MKTWPHNVVFQIGMYTLFILVIIMEQLHSHKVYRQRRSEPPESTQSTTTAGDCVILSTTVATSLLGYLTDLIIGFLIRIHGSCSGSNILHLFMRFVWPVVLIIVIDWYSNILKIYRITFAFYAIVLFLMVPFHCIRAIDGIKWSRFHCQRHPTYDSPAAALDLQTTFDLFLRVSSGGLLSYYVLSFMRR